VDECPDAPEAHQERLEGRHLKGLRGLEHHGAERQGGQEPD
jgi:hypothetical protein